MRVTVLGSGTSVGVPAIGCRCPVCRSNAPENKRLRSSIYIEHPGGTLLVDCSTDFRAQALRSRLRRVDAVVMTHDHADHVNGVDDLRSFNFMQGGPIRIYADDDVVETLRRRCAYCFNPVQIGGGVPQLEILRIDKSRPFAVDGLEVVPVPIKHGVLDILGYRFGPYLAYLTDCSAVPASSLLLIEGVDTLIVDALRWQPHATHFGLAQALALADRVGARRTWFTHISCKLDHFLTNAALPSRAQLLHDTQVLELPDPPGPAAESEGASPGAGERRA